MKVVTFGEIMLRLAPEGYMRFTQAERFGATYGGGEANVAVSLSCLGAQAAFVSKLPQNELGQAAINSLRRYGVNTDFIARGGERIGIYFLEKGASQRPSKVVYDRAHSAISTCEENDFDWAQALHGADWFHFTGITPALSERAFKACLRAVQCAQKLGIMVSCDLNYRKNLWTRTEAGQKMSALMPFVNVCISNEEDAKDVFGIEVENTDITSGKLSHEGYESVAQKLVERFGLRSVVITLRESLSANDNVWGGMLYDGKQCYFSKKYALHIVDRVGGGDSFGAGLIYASLSGFDAQKTVEFAAAASALKHSIEGDFNLTSADEVLRLAGGDGSGRVQR